MELCFCVLSHIRQCHYEVMKIGFLSGLDDLFHGDIACVIAILNVLCNAAIKQRGLLGHYANLRSQEGHIDSLRYMTIDQLKTKNHSIKKRYSFGRY